MKHSHRILCLTASVLTLLNINNAQGYSKTKIPFYRSPWNGFFVGGLLGGKLISGNGSITTYVDGRDETASKNDIIFPLPSHALNVGFNSEFADSSTIAFGCDFDYGVLPTLKLSYGYLVTPLDRISFGVGINALLLAAAFSTTEEVKVSSLYGFTPSISYERSIGNGAFFQVQATYNYFSAKGANLGRDHKFSVPVRRFIRDYWDKDVHSVRGIDVTAHGFTLSTGFGYTF